MNHSMKRRLLILLLLILVRAGLHSQSQEKPVAPDRKVPTIELRGEGYARGLQHGEALGKEIDTVFALWKRSIQKVTMQNPDSILARFYNATRFEPAIKKWTPQLYEELKGLAEGSGQTFRDVLCFQLVDELWVFLDRQNHIGNHHCSGMGIAATHHQPAMVAQNMDLESYMNNYQVLLHLAANSHEPEQFVLSCAGLIGLNGINAKGIGLCVNTLMELEASTDGLPVACVVRGILSKPTGVDALDFLKTVRHASGQNYILGIGDMVYDFEASANKVVRFMPDAASPSLVYHTNHAMANDDLKPWYRASNARILSGEITNDNSVVRLTSLKKRLGTVPEDISEDIIKETLRSKDDQDNPVCRTYNEKQNGFTFSSVVLTLGRYPSMELTFGSPDQSEYIKHTFRETK